MEYIILNRTTNIIVNTEVEYDFDGKKVIVLVSHFNPQSEEEIIKGIENRAVTEEQKLIENENDFPDQI